MNSHIAPEHLAELAHRILAVMPRVPRDRLDRLAAEVGIMIGELCTDQAAADELTERLTRYPFRRFHFAELRLVAESMARKSPAAPAVTFDAYRDEPPEKIAALEREAKRRGVQSLAEAELALQLEAEQLLPRLPDYARRLEAGREEWRKLAQTFKAPRTCEPPFLDRNATIRAELELFRELLYKPEQFRRRRRQV